MSRATFHGRYTVADAQRDPKTKGPRLLDYITMVQAIGDGESVTEPASDEFCVVDLTTKEKAFVNRPRGYTPATGQAMIESFFAARATRVAESLWVV